MRCFWSASLVWGLSRYLLESKSGTGHEANQKGRKTLPLCRSVCQHGARGSTQLTSVEPCSWQSLNRPCKPTATSTFHRGENGAGSSGPFVPRTVRGQVLNPGSLPSCLHGHPLCGPGGLVDEHSSSKTRAVNGSMKAEACGHVKGLLWARTLFSCLFPSHWRATRNSQVVWQRADLWGFAPCYQLVHNTRLLAFQGEEVKK